ncbi:2-oxoglutarate dehydrogenase E1 component [Paenibacillus sp. J31TS4]|uniref:2-oxoglutarate dehydrogenase E1 component n=1 Tax=Paenibacillus sp. J31TS4 TaxID=2807195 RepID=UPI001B13CCBE|nr:2-oxoglutarate dehydrogenase E1 component [Paenibacillus sp. J31TS4]GIP39435.1 2-oxoglutarate dehydrogenase E1 component [Paenibacillus sp. J31TS4]
MTTGQPDKQTIWQSYSGPNLGYLYEQYEKYETDPNSVEPSFRELFDTWGAPPALSSIGEAGQPAGAPAGGIDPAFLKKVVAAEKLVWNIRTYGHLDADLDPLELQAPADTRLLEPETYGLTQADLSAMPASLIWEHAPASISNGWEAIRKLRQQYTKQAAFEFSHVHNEAERDWLHKFVETDQPAGAVLSADRRKKLLDRLVHVEQFEAFLHKTFVGQKRFSVEGTDALIPMLDGIIHHAANAGAEHVMMGMAHRGRLNVLAHVMRKPYGQIFAEFHHSPNKDLVPSEGSIGINAGWTGDVKYHMGAERAVQEDEKTIRLTLANNPSHLEFVNPVVQGFARAAQEVRTAAGYPEQDIRKAYSVLMHGDAAFAGEGIVAESLNLSRLKGFQVGGTIHIIVNNRIGFTTESEDSRSTRYASDLAKGYEIPIVHVNADDPEACLEAIRMACEYKAKFNKDFLIDLVGYRRFGHNESDDPEMTQPITYAKVHSHPTAASVYAERLVKEGAIDSGLVDELRSAASAELQAAYEEVKAGTFKVEGEASDLKQVPAELDTAVALEELVDINTALLQWPEGFNVYPKLKRILERRGKAFEQGEKIDWALAETLAFATLVAEGKPIRLTGQDSERGTFSHRHIVLHDSKTGDTFSPLHELPQAKASFAVYNSPLSEASVLGFEYGYNVYAPETLVLWEAQFGDFANAGQVLIDQFIAAGRGKWKELSSLVLLLPHGYEGQGPEHSSARLERFLQLAGDENWTVGYLTKSSQFFHLLRRQAALSETEAARPLVLMSPKSLLRNQRVAAPASEFTSGGFRPVLEQEGLGGAPDRVERLILCTGKVAVDLEEALDADGEDRSWLHIARVEQLYPFPKEELAAVIGKLPNLREIVWVQEEPRNMGAWNFMESKIRDIAPSKATVRYVGRPDRSSPASGFSSVHKLEQQQIVTEALEQPSYETTKTRGKRS